jgi:hypothetical protein
LPLSQAQVRITGFTPVPGVPPPLAATDQQGRFEFTAMPGGRVTITASKTGYVTLAYGQRRLREPGRPVEIGVGQLVERIDIALPRGGALVARVTDDLGGALAGVRVQVESYRFNAAQGARILAGGPFATTDDRGEAHFTGLAPGEYYVSANAGLGRTNPAIAADDAPLRYGQPTYYPGVASGAEASRIAIAAGQQTTIAFPMTIVRTAQVRGVVKTIESRPQDLTVFVSPGGSGTSFAPRPDGSFDMLNAMPGRYTFSVRPGRGRGAVASGGEYASVSAVVAGNDVTHVVIPTVKAGTLRGHFVFDTGAPPANVRPNTILVSLSGFLSTGMPYTPVTNNDWTFEVSNVAGPGMVRLQPTTTDWFLKTVRLDSKDITDIPTDFSTATDFKSLEVVLTQKRTELSGRFGTIPTPPPSEYVVVVFPENRALWTAQSRFIGVGRPDQQGQFRILGLPPGRYLAAAVDFLETGEERDPELLAGLESAAQLVTLGDAETKRIILESRNLLPR